MKKIEKYKAFVDDQGALRITVNENVDLQVGETFVLTKDGALFLEKNPPPLGVSVQETIEFQDKVR